MTKRIYDFKKCYENRLFYNITIKINFKHFKININFFHVELIKTLKIIPFLLRTMHSMKIPNNVSDTFHTNSNHL